ncbi:MAG: KpsF/GutQ family sugar-phosphate isomerase [Janthinobacterium lividum]
MSDRKDNADQDKWRTEGQRVLTEAAHALNRLAGTLDGPAWADAVRLILKTQGRVVVTGMGKSGIIAVKMAGTLSSTGTPAQFLHPAEGVHGDLGMLQPGDLVIAFSYSGETDEVLAILPALGQLETPLIAVTGNAQSTLARAAEVVLDVFVEREACPMNLAPTTSTTVMLSLSDALAVTVMVARDFTPDQYVRLHPAGTLGRRLTLRVADVMRTGDAMAVLPMTSTVLEAMFAITQANAGAAIITDGEGRVTGLLTDGDIRRHLLDNQHILSHPASEAMTSSPGVVRPEMLATEGLHRLDTFHPLPGQKAGDAPVVDAEGRPVGMLTLKDLVKAGIV